MKDSIQGMRSELYALWQDITYHAFEKKVKHDFKFYREGAKKALQYRRLKMIIKEMEVIEMASKINWFRWDQLGRGEGNKTS